MNMLCVDEIPKLNLMICIQKLAQINGDKKIKGHTTRHCGTGSSLEYVNGNITEWKMFCRKRKSDSKGWTYYLYTTYTFKGPCIGD